MTLKPPIFTFHCREASYGYCSFKNPAALKLVVVKIGQQTFSIGVEIKMEAVDSQRIETFARNHQTVARRAARGEDIERYMPEILAYIRNLDPNCYSPFLDDLTDGDDREMAETEVRQAMTSALDATDDFRSAVAFERANAFLVADVGLIDVIANVRRSLDRDYDPEKWLTKTAKEMEREICQNSQLVARHVDIVKSALNETSQEVKP